MKEKKFLKIFYKDPIIQFHYVLLTLFLFLAFYIGDKYFNLPNLSVAGMFFFWLISITLSDQIIHFIIGRD